MTLIEWVREQHAGQLIKKTNLPYFEHLLFVAEMAGPYAPFGYEVGLCHDLLEKTQTTRDELFQKLISFGYSETSSLEITRQVVELTDVFTKTSYPGLHKAERKLKEEQRLTGISSAAQTVKYADLWYNLEWMTTYSIAHSQDYAKRKLVLLKDMSIGNPELLTILIAKLQAAL